VGLEADPPPTAVFLPFSIDLVVGVEAVPADLVTGEVEVEELVAGVETAGGAFPWDVDAEEVVPPDC